MLLSEQELRSALEPLLDRLLIERLRYFQLQLEPRLHALLAAAIAQSGSGAETGAGMERLLSAGAPDHIFTEVFEATRELVGEARALLVTWQGEVAVWRSQAVKLPARFAAADQEAVLGQAPGAGALPLRVRNSVVGWLYWEAAGGLEPSTQRRLEVCLRVAGLLLLEQGLAMRAAARNGTAASALVAAQTPIAEGAEDTAERAGTGPELRRRPGGPQLGGSEQERAFAELLVEDLALYLERERPGELLEARRLGDGERRFQPEMERCRRAFIERFPNHARQAASSDESDEEFWRGAMQRL